MRTGKKTVLLLVLGFLEVVFLSCTFASTFLAVPQISMRLCGIEVRRPRRTRNFGLKNDKKPKTR